MMKVSAVINSAIVYILLLPMATPFEYKICNLGWKHISHKHNEASYQNAWCSLNGGIAEFKNKDFTRVDCLTNTHAIEFDFADKWAQSLGQALHYSVMTGKKPKVILILDEPYKQMIYFKRVQKIGEEYKIDTEYVTNDILKLNKEQKCGYSKCKCHNK